LALLFTFDWSSKKSFSSVFLYNLSLNAGNKPSSSYNILSPDNSSETLVSIPAPVTLEHPMKEVAVVPL